MLLLPLVPPVATAVVPSWHRQAGNHRKVLVNLDKIIASLQALRPEGDNAHD